MQQDKGAKTYVNGGIAVQSSLEPSSKEDTPLIKAIQKQDYNRFEALMETEDVNEPGSYGLTPLIAACYINTKIGRAMIQRLLRSPEINVNQEDDQGMSPLGVATVRNSRLVVVALLRRGANPNIHTYTRLKGGYDSQGKDYNRWRQVTPLSLAARRHDKRMADVLLKFGASVDLLSDLDITPLSMSARGDDVDMMAYFHRNGAHLDIMPTNWQEYTNQKEKGCPVVLRKVLKYGSINCLRYLINAGLRIPNVIYKKGGEQMPILTYLLSQPIPFSEQANYESCARLLLGSGYDSLDNIRFTDNQKLNIADADFLGRNALYYAAYSYGEDLCAQLATKETMCRRDIDGDTPYSVAIRRGELPIIRMFLEKGVNPNEAVHYYPWTITELDSYPNGITEPGIFYAMKRKDERLAALLIQKGANLVWQNSEGKRPLDYLDKEFSPEFRQFFIKRMEMQKANLNVSAQNKQLNTMARTFIKKERS